MKTIYSNYRKAQALAIVQLLIEESRWFQVEPEPFDVYSITVKAERELPVALGLNNAGAEVPFMLWVTEVEDQYGRALDKSSPADANELRVFEDYFTRGLTPQQAFLKNLDPSEEN